MEGYIKKQFSRGFRNRVILLTLIFIVIGFFVYGVYNAGVLNPQTVVKHEDLNKNTSIDDTKYVNFESSEIAFSGYYYIEDEKDKAKYYLVNMQDRYILGLLPIDTEDYLEQYSFSARLRAPDSVDTEVIAELRAYAVSEFGLTNEEAMLEIPSDYIAESLEYKSDKVGFYMGVIAEALLLIAILYNLFYAIYPTKHRKFKKLEQYGDIETVLETIERDMEGENKYLDTKSIKIMENYVIRKSAYGFNVYKTSDIIWIYKLITQNRYNGIPTGKTYAIKIQFANKKEAFFIPMKNEKVADETIQNLMNKMPNVIYGFTDELLQKYNKDYEGFKLDWENKKLN